ncbi:hypothetical protein EDC01DRAFT_730302 [Geopyxis carbonaria]|nr:hypothetical protein EDC01DRAFT_730302 [Geopyxis carbonaria]
MESPPKKSNPTKAGPPGTVGVSVLWRAFREKRRHRNENDEKLSPTQNSFLPFPPTAHHIYGTYFPLRFEVIKQTEDAEIRRHVSGLSGRIEDHIANFYDAKMVLDPTFNPSSRLQNMLENQQTRYITLRRVIAEILIDSISTHGNPPTTLSMGGVMGLTRGLRTDKISSYRKGRQYSGNTDYRLDLMSLLDISMELSKWRIITSRLFHPEIDTRLTLHQEELETAIRCITSRISYHTGVYIKKGRHKVSRLDLENIVRETAELSDLLFSQPVEWQFGSFSNDECSPPADEESLGNNQTSLPQLKYTVFPSLQRLTDREGRLLPNVITSLESEFIEYTSTQIPDEAVLDSSHRNLELHRFFEKASAILERVEKIAGADEALHNLADVSRAANGQIITMQVTLGFIISMDDASINSQLLDRMGESYTHLSAETDRVGEILDTEDFLSSSSLICGWMAAVLRTVCDLNSFLYGRKCMLICDQASDLLH